jgi:hypothetical protein
MLWKAPDVGFGRQTAHPSKQEARQVSMQASESLHEDLRRARTIIAVEHYNTSD